MPQPSPSRTWFWQQDLSPFGAAPALRPFNLRASATWCNGLLEVHYRLGGPLADLVLPGSQASSPQRRDNLWQSSCFELFIAEAGHTNYWELNLSPNGDWNVYRLESYRTGLTPELEITRLPHRIQHHLGSTGREQLEVKLSLELAGAIDAQAELELSATTVLEHQRLGCSYWAWLHTGKEPDFHRRDSLKPGLSRG